MITCDNITFRYRGRSEPALRGLKLTVRDGEAVCVMGPNGSGKSTLVRMLAGLLKPDEGRVLINGEPAAASDRAPLVGIMFQNPDNQMVAMVVDQEIAFALENLAVPMSRMERIVGASLARYHITHLANRLTSELSGGEKQRVALAGATINRPTVLVLDEPDSFLDEAGRTILDAELQQMRSAMPEMIELRVTQYPHIARSYPRLIVIDHGWIVADDKPEKIFRNRDFCLKYALQFDAELELESSSYPSVIAGPHDGRPGKIIAEGITFGYSRRSLVLDSLSFSLSAGETIGLVGPTGSGKSSLGLLLSGVLKPMSGTIMFLDDYGITLGARQHPGWVTAVLQQPERQFFLSTCAKEVAFGPENLERPLTDEEVRDYLTLVGLDPGRFAERDPFSLSVGEKRRLAFASVLSMSPSFVVFDEPTASLDQQGVGRFVALSRLLKSRGIGQIVVSHEGDLIRALADRVLWLKGDGSHEIVSTDTLFGRNDFAGQVSRINPS